jgi:hypothetical protein
VVPAACIFFAGGPRASVEVRPSLHPLILEGDEIAKLGRETRREIDHVHLHWLSEIVAMKDATERHFKRSDAINDVPAEAVWIASALRAWQ